MEVETCENLRPGAGAGGAGGSSKIPAQTPHQYGFADKVVDGITVTVNSVLLTLHSHVFTASFQVIKGLILKEVGCDLFDLYTHIFSIVGKPKFCSGFA